MFRTYGHRGCARVSYQVLISVISATQVAGIAKHTVTKLRILANYRAL